MGGYCHSRSVCAVCEVRTINPQLSLFYNEETQQVREPAWGHVVISD